MERAEGSKGRKMYKTSLGGKIAGFVKSHEKEARLLEKEIAHSRHELESVIDTFLKNPNDDLKIVIQTKHAIFLKHTHQLKAVLQRLEKEIVEKLKEFTEEIEKKKIKEISLEEWKDMREDIEDLCDDILDTVHYERVQERRGKRSRRIRRKKNRVFTTTSAQRQRMMRRSKRDRKHAEEDTQTLNHLDTQKDFMLTLWQANSRRQFDIEKKLKKVKKKDHELGTALLKEEKAEHVTTKKSLDFFRRFAKSDIRKVAATVATITALATTNVDKVQAQNFDVSDRLQKTGQNIKSTVKKGREDRTFYVNKNKQSKFAIEIENPNVKGEAIYVLYVNKGNEKRSMEEITIYNKEKKPITFMLNTTKGDNAIDHVYEVYYSKRGSEMQELENVVGGEYVKYFMIAKNKYLEAAKSPRRDKYVSIDPFNYKAAKLRKGVIRTAKNIGDTFRILVKGE